MQDDDNGSMGRASAPQAQPSAPSVDPAASVDTQQMNAGEQTSDQPVAGGEAPNPAPTVSQPVSEVVAGPTASASIPTSAPTSSPVPITPTVAGAPAATDSVMAAPEKKKSKTLVIVLSILAVVAIGVVVAVALLMGNKGGNLSIGDVEKYCESNGFTVDTDHEEEDGNIVDAVQCTVGSEGGDNKISMIQYAVANKPILEIDGFDAGSYVSYLGGSLLVDESDYKKIYMSIFGQSAYVVIRGNTYMMIAGSNEEMKKVLIDFGYPDDKWSDGSTTTGNWGSDDDEDEPSSLKTMQRDTQRRNDLSRVDTSLVQYQTNNSGKLMTGPSYWEGSATFNCDTNNVACQFVQDYLNSSNSNKNEFEDPDGTPYSVFITENWVDNGSITTSFGSNLSKLVESDDEGYTIGGSSPLDAHVIYIVPGGSCSYYTDVVKASSNRNFAVLYQLEDDEEAYCIDDL